MAKKKRSPKGRTNRRAQSGGSPSNRLEALVSLQLSSFEDARNLISKKEIYDFIEQSENSGVTDMKDADGIYDSANVVRHYLRAEGQNIASFLSDYGNSLTTGTVAEKIQAVTDMKTNVEKALTHLVNVYVGELNVNTLKQRAADHTLLADAAGDTAKYKLTTKNGKASFRKKLKTPEYQALFDAMLPLLGRPIPKPRTPRAPGTPRKSAVSAAYSKLISLANDPNAYQKVESQQGIDDLRKQFKGQYQIMFDDVVLPLLKVRAADHKYEEARNAFSSGYSGRQTALDYLNVAIALGSGKAKTIKDTYESAIKIIRESEGKQGENDKSRDLLRTIEHEVNVTEELGLIGLMRFAQWNAYVAEDTTKPVAERKALYQGAVDLLNTVVQSIPDFKEANNCLAEYQTMSTSVK